MLLPPTLLPPSSCSIQGADACCYHRHHCPPPPVPSPVPSKVAALGSLGIRINRVLPLRTKCPGCVRRGCTCDAGLRGATVLCQDEAGDQPGRLFWVRSVLLEASPACWYHIPPGRVCAWRTCVLWAPPCPQTGIVRLVAFPLQTDGELLF